jgi:hypothetical protein
MQRENAAGKRSAGSRKTRSVHNATPIFNPQREKKNRRGFPQNPLCSQCNTDF